MIRVKLSGTPPSTQSIYRHGNRVTYMTEVGRKTKEAFQWEMKSQYKGEPLKSPVSVIIEFYFKDNIRRDLDNFNKLVLDSGTKLLWQDDSQIEELILRKFIDKKRPRVEMVIMP